MSDAYRLTGCGELLSQMEHRCRVPGHWIIEGYLLDKVKDKWVLTDNLDKIPVPSFAAGVTLIAEKMKEE